MEGRPLWTAAIDRADREQQVWISDAEGGQLAKRGFPHGGGWTGSGSKRLIGSIPGSTDRC